MKISDIVVERGQTAEGSEKRFVGFQVNKTIYDTFREAYPNINLTKTFEGLLVKLTEASKA